MGKGRQTGQKNQDITSAERLIRINAVKQLLLQGAKKQDIEEYCKDEFNIGQSTIDKYTAEAKAEIKEDFKNSTDIEFLKALFMQRMEDLYFQSYNLEDYKHCSALIKDQISFMGMESPKKLDHTNNGEKFEAAKTTIVWGGNKIEV